MLTTRQPVFRKFWHACMPLAHLADGPRPFTLLGENIVLFLDENGEPAALKDRCCPIEVTGDIGGLKMPREVDTVAAVGIRHSYNPNARFAMMFFCTSLAPP